MKRERFGCVSALAALVILAFCSIARAEWEGHSLAESELKPGATLKIIDPLTKGHGFWALYLPKDFTPDRAFPVIFFFHGRNGDALAYPFPDLTDGKGFIIVGMEYMDHDNPTAANDLPNLHRIHDDLAKRMKLNDQLLFIAGFSQGGWATSDFAESSLDTWAGIIITSAGRGGNGSGNSSTAKKLIGKPIFVAAGDSDPYRKDAEAAADYYKKAGADVTLKIFPNTGHAVDNNDATLKQWLKDHGPLVAVKQNLTAAADAEKSGAMGKAYVLYKAVVDDPNAGDQAKDADTNATRISDAADAVLADVETSLTNKKYADASKALIAAVAKYAGSPPGDKLKAKLTEIQTDPDIKAEIAQAKIDSDADAEEQAAQNCEKLKDYKQALALYEHYVSAYPKSHRFAEVSTHLADLKADKSIQTSMNTNQTDSDCKGWLSLADAYIKNDLPDKARTMLQKVIDKYPNTDYAAQAKEKLAAIH